MTTTEIIRQLRASIKTGIPIGLLRQAADRLEELDERVAIMEEGMTSEEKDADIMRRCREGEVKKYVGHGVVLLNYDWWQEHFAKTGLLAPSERDLEE